MKIVSTAEDVSIIKSGDRVFLQGAAMTPNILIDALCERHASLKDVEIISIHTEGEAKYPCPNIAVRSASTVVLWEAMFAMR